MLKYFFNKLDLYKADSIYGEVDKFNSECKILEVTEVINI